MSRISNANGAAAIPHAYPVNMISGRLRRITPARKPLPANRGVQESPKPRDSPLEASLEKAGHWMAQTTIVTTFDRLRSGKPLIAYRQEAPCEAQTDAYLQW